MFCPDATQIGAEKEELHGPARLQVVVACAPVEMPSLHVRTICSPVHGAEEQVPPAGEFM
jgi:hypothetical protein